MSLGAQYGSVTDPEFRLQGTHNDVGQTGTLLWCRFLRAPTQYSLPQQFSRSVLLPGLLSAVIAIRPFPAFATFTPAMVFVFPIRFSSRPHRSTSAVAGVKNRLGPPVDQEIGLSDDLGLGTLAASVEIDDFA